MNNKKFSLSLLAHDFTVPMNIGSLFRIADSFGVEMLYLTGTSPVPPNHKIRKTSRSTEQHVPFCYESSPFSVVERLQQQGYTIISLELAPESIELDTLTVLANEKICLVLGSERQGVCQELLNMSNKIVSIPMMGVNTSMNVAMACAIASYEITRKTILQD